MHVKKVKLAHTTRLKRKVNKVLEENKAENKATKPN